MTRLSAILAVVAVAALLSGTYLATRNAGGDARFEDCEGTVTAGGDIGGPFELVTEDGLTVTDAEVIDRPALVYFGYTYCPDVCPFDAARNAEAADLLAALGHDVRPVFITVDPARDTTEVLEAFTGNLHPQMVGLTGSDEQVRAAQRAYRVYARAHGAPPQDDYLVDHSTFTYLMLPQEGFVTFFRGAPGLSGEGLTAEQVAVRAACYIENA